MFTINKKAKNLTMALMAIGLIALIFGFVQILMELGLHFYSIHISI